MTLYDYILRHKQVEELTVGDAIYDMETYINTDTKDVDNWQNSIIELSKKLTVIKTITKDRIIVNFADLIERNLDNLKDADLYNSYDLDDIMDDLSFVLSGYVSENWLNKFVNALK